MDKEKVSKELAIKLIKRATPAEALLNIRFEPVWLCPSCKCEWTMERKYNYCPNCGQRIDWEDDEEEDEDGDEESC